jgi:hypothetical protein
MISAAAGLMRHVGRVTGDERSGPASPNSARGERIMATKTKKTGKKTTTTKATAPTKPKADAKPKAEPKPKRVSCLDAAAQVLRDAGEPMQARAMVTAMKEKGLWSSDAPTPHATLYSAIVREITNKKDASRFKKTDRGHFALNT